MKGAHWQAAARWIEAALGLHYPAARQHDLHRALEAAAPGFGLPDADACARWLPTQAPNRESLQRLAEHLTIGETYFFRDPAALDALAQRALVPLIAERRNGPRRLRVWSAGCSSGEEAYTLAIVLQRLLPDRRDWQVSVTGTDVHAGALAKAREGCYGGWSFRNAPPWLQPQYFDRQPDGRWRVVPEIRSMVHFAPLNLVDESSGACAGCPDLWALDLIVCRNVLMYLSPRHIVGVLARMHGRLVDGGWMAVAPTEAAAGPPAGFDPISHAGALLFRKPLPGATPRVTGRRPVARATAGAAAAPRGSGMVQCAGPAPTAGLPAPSELGALAARARCRADQGRFEDALACCDRWLAADPLNPAAHHLRALVLLEQGDEVQACAALRRALYLNPDHAPAHLALGGVARRAGRSEQARRHFVSARSLMERPAPAQPGAPA